MMKRLITTAVAVSALGLLGTSGAQEGHPLKGSWLGEWSGNSVHGDNILLILDWDGKAITGMINPGTDNMPLKAASLEPNGWVVKLEADGKDKDGSAVRYVIEGKLENLELAESLDHRHVVEQQGPRHVHGEPAMRLRSAMSWCLAVCAALCAPLAAAHHPVTAKFDDAKRTELRGIVTNVDWRNPHVHVFTNVTRENGETETRAVELESTVLLRRSGWKRDTLRPGDAISVTGPTARNGSRQVWGETVIATATNRQVYNVTDVGPPRPQSPRPTPRGADGKPLLGSADEIGGYSAYPSSTVLMQPVRTCR